jgi:adenine-specific DNA-methyltransferase
MRVLDPGAGVGSLFAALVATACGWEEKPQRLSVTAYEIDPALATYLPETLDLCADLCESVGIEFSGEVRTEDFIRSGIVGLQNHELFPADQATFDAVILNPPYRKINADSETRHLLGLVGIETSNLYAGFLWLAMRMLDEDGELVAITPRSFCNGPYFRPFRQELVTSMSFRRLHVFDSRQRAFSDDEVLQENIIFHAVKNVCHQRVTITSSLGPDDEDVTVREVEHDQLVRPEDANAFIHIVPTEIGDRIREEVRGLSASLSDLGLTVSTGRVVDFRAKQLLRSSPGPAIAPLIYPVHFSSGFVAWPSNGGRKPNGLAMEPGAEPLLVPADYYVLVKRFSSKEERRRVVAAVYDPGRVAGEWIGFENHLNYYHQGGAGLPPDLAKGLAAFLNSTLVDSYFRQFSGHTQVNATDLRSLNYPAMSKLLALGRRIGETFPSQDELDRLIREEVMADKSKPDPTEAEKRIGEARTILKELNVPKEQQNDRSALTLLALLDMRPGLPWSKAGDPLRGITEMMDYFKEHFGVTYAPNTRETVRRFTVHQFVQIGLVLANPDDPARPVNSPDNRYQIEPAALKLIRGFRTTEWEKRLPDYLKALEKLNRLRSRERDMNLIAVKLPDGREIALTAGGQNILVKEILEEFCPRYTPGGTIVYVGDTGDKYLCFEEEYLKNLGVEIDKHGKMPDVAVHYSEKNWLVLIEAVTSHGPVNLKRHNELKELFRTARAGLVFVTAFLTKKAMGKYLNDIAWETEVWVAEAPTHLIHFNGERFLGPDPDLKITE